MSEIEKRHNKITKITPDIEYLEGLKRLGDNYLDDFFKDSREQQKFDMVQEEKKLEQQLQQIQNNHEENIGWQQVEIAKIKEISKDKLSGRIFSYTTLLTCLGIFIYLIQSGNKELLLPYTAFISAIIGLVALYVHSRNK